MNKAFLLVLMFISLNAGHMNVGYSTASLSEFSKKDTMIVMDIWIQELMKGSKHTASFTFYDDIEIMANDFNHNKLDYVLANGVEFVKYFDNSKLIDGFTGGMSDRSSENLIVLIKEKTSITQLKNKKTLKIAMQRNNSVSELYAKYMILQHHVNKSIIYIKTKKSSGALLNLFFNKTDIAIVTKKTFDFAKELNPQIGKMLKIVKYSNIPAGSFGYFRESFDTDLKNEITEMAYNLTNNAKGRQVMAIFKTKELIEIKVEDLSPIKQLYQEYLKLQRINK